MMDKSNQTEISGQAVTIRPICQADIVTSSAT